MTQYAIEASAIQKVFKTRVEFWGGKTKGSTAVEEVSFHFRKEELLGLLGTGLDHKRDGTDEAE